ncbi:hypothetical protein [Amycolatopsis benzoatilytica]|uniref:hypothetical protein n=1 Tax=Amycolatopsis benzoatilytica TaxID=346045 RepID=UPI00036BD562|nr:hypothetical protein [Amycolatopsis benzoatilytica]
MRGKGMTYETGFVRNGRSSRPSFEPEVVRRELAIIRDDLHCTAVHLVGGDPERLDLAAQWAAELGLEVWFSPYPLDATEDEMLALFADCATRAERLRAGGANVVFVTGVELSVMVHGFIPGADTNERLGWLFADPDGRAERIAEVSKRLDVFLDTAVRLVRQHFYGPVTYAAIQYEQLDWSRFDFVTMELIRSAAVADIFQAGVRTLVSQGKPVAITGFGTATWRGAGDVAPRSLEVVEYDPETGDPVRLDGEYERDEAGQAAYVRELLEIFDAEGVDSAFVFLFALCNYPHRPDGEPRLDLDLASFGMVKVLEHGSGTAYPGLNWEPKEVFAAVAEHYSR